MKQKKDLNKMELALLTQVELTKVSGGIIGIVVPVALAFGAGYAVGSAGRMIFQKLSTRNSRS